MCVCACVCVFLSIFHKGIRINFGGSIRGGGCLQQLGTLLWGEEYAKSFLSQQPNESKYDIILGSNLIYVQSVIKPLFETVEVMLREASNSKFLMAHCARREGNEVDLHMVLDVAEEKGFGYDVVVEDDDISVFSFKRRQS